MFKLQLNIFKAMRDLLNFIDHFIQEQTFRGRERDRERGEREREREIGLCRCFYL